MSNTPKSSNDSDDWTLVTPPHSSSSSPSRLDSRESRNQLSNIIEQALAENLDDATAPAAADEPIPLDDCEEVVESDSPATGSEPDTENDNELIDIDLNDDTGAQSPTTPKLVPTPQNQTRRFARPTTTLANLRYKTSGPKVHYNSTMSQTYVVRAPVKSLPILHASNSTTVLEKLTTDRSVATNTPFDDDFQTSSPASSSRRRGDRNSQLDWQFTLQAISVMFLMIMIYVGIHLDNESPNPSIKKESDNKETRSFNLMETDVSEHAYVELKLMNEDIEQCIKRENPGLNENIPPIVPQHVPDYNPHNVPYVRNKPFVGFVCYEDEDEWRKRFDRLKKEFNLDFRKVLRQARKHLTRDLIASYHPSLNFNLIQNQLEYVDYMDQARNKRRQEETIKQLVAENARLRAQMREPNESEVQRTITSLEDENSKLKRDIESLRSNLAEKTGTVYVRQSLELERCDRENNALKEFHHHISQDISKSLRKLNLHTIDASTIAHDDLGSLNSQLTITRGYLQRLTEELDALISRNDALKDDLKFAYSLYTTHDNTHDESGFIGNHMLNAISDDLPSVALSSIRTSQEASLAASTPIGSRQTSENQSESTSDKTLEDLATRFEQESKLEKPDWSLKRSKLRERLRKSVDNLDYSCQAKAKKPTPTSGHNLNNRRDGESRRTYNGNDVKPKKHHNQHDTYDRFNNHKHKKYEKRTNHNRETRYQYVSSYA